MIYLALGGGFPQIAAVIALTRSKTRPVQLARAPKPSPEPPRCRTSPPRASGRCSRSPTATARPTAPAPVRSRPAARLPSADREPAPPPRRLVQRTRCGTRRSSARTGPATASARTGLAASLPTELTSSGRGPPTLPPPPPPLPPQSQTRLTRERRGAGSGRAGRGSRRRRRPTRLRLPPRPPSHRPPARERRLR